MDGPHRRSSWPHDCRRPEPTGGTVGAKRGPLVSAAYRAAAGRPSCRLQARLPSKLRPSLCSISELLGQRGCAWRMYVRFTPLPVVDQDRAIAFYTEALGFRVAEDSPYQEGWRWVLLEIPGAQTKVLLTRKRAEEPRDGTPSLVLTVDDVHKHWQQLAAKGVVFTSEPAVAPWNK